MKKRVLALIISLIAVSMIVGPLVYANLWKEETTTWFKIHEPGAFTDWFKYIPSYPDYTALFAEGRCNVGGYKINIGGTLTLKPGYSDVYEITGGTTFEKGIDFDYEGKIFTEMNYDENQVLLTATYTLFYNITFNPKSPNHGIDGMLTFVSHTTIFYDTDPVSHIGKTYGIGTGDLEGVTVQASKGPTMWDADMEFEFLGTQEGTITGFPINKIKSN